MAAAQLRAEVAPLSTRSRCALEPRGLTHTGFLKMTLSNLWLIPSFGSAEIVSVIQRGVDLMLREWR